jgi:hypothetical protein
MSNINQMSQYHFKRFQRLASRLSLENLCCDGELSAQEVAASAAQINAEWKSLEKEVGVGSVSLEEVERHHSWHQIPVIGLRRATYR